MIWTLLNTALTSAPLSERKEKGRVNNLMIQSSLSSSCWSNLYTWIKLSLPYLKSLMALLKLVPWFIFVFPFFCYMSESLKTIIYCIRIWPWWLQPCQCFIKKNWHQKLFPILETYWWWEQGIHLIELLHSHANFQYAFAAFLLPSKVATHAYQNFEVYYLKTMTVCHFFFFF